MHGFFIKIKLTNSVGTSKKSKKKFCFARDYSQNTVYGLSVAKKQKQIQEINFTEIKIEQQQQSSQLINNKYMLIVLVYMWKH